MASYISLVNFNAPGGRCDVTPMFSSPSEFQQLVGDLLGPFRDSDVQLVAGIDALGFIFGTALAVSLGVGFVPVRKMGKLPVPSDHRKFVDYTNKEKSLELGQGAVLPGSRVLVTDDWIETGAQMYAAVDLIERQGGIIVGICALNIDENDLTLQLRERYYCHSVLRNCVAS
jgi:adenine phosphoribosyltransferase